MPESEAQKEIRRQQTELDRSIREDGPSPIPDDPKEPKSPSAFRREEMPEGAEIQRQPSQNVRVIENSGSDGMEDASTKELFRELIQVSRSIESKLTELGQG